MIAFQIRNAHWLNIKFMIVLIIDHLLNLLIEVIVWKLISLYENNFWEVINLIPDREILFCPTVILFPLNFVLNSY